jgi:O-antigen ligase
MAHPAFFALGAILAVAYHLSGSGTINFAILALFGLLFLYDPGLAPPFIAASLPFWQRTQPVLRWEFGLFEALAWIAVLAWTGRAVLTPARSPRPAHPRVPSLDLSLLALFASGLLATIFAAEQGVAWREFRIVFLFGLVFYGLITRGGLNRATIRPLVAGLLAGATIAAGAGLLQLVTGRGMVQTEGVSRIAGFYGSPNNLALILDRAVPLALALALFGSFGARTRVLRGLLGIVALVCLLAAVATFSKGAILLGLPAGIAVVLLGGAWRSGKRWPLWLLLAGGVVAAGGLLILFQTPRFADLFNFEAGTTFFRIRLWQGALNMALDHPVLGVGPDNFLYAYRTRYVLPSAWQELNLSHPHNVFLDLWTRLGVIGVIAGIAAFAATCAAGWRIFAAGRAENRKATEDSERAETSLSSQGPLWQSSRSAWPLALGLLGGLAATAAHGLIDNSLFLPDLMGWFVAAAGIFWLVMVRGED